MGFPGGASGKEPTCQCWRHKRCEFNLQVRKISQRRAWQPTPVFLLRESHEQRSLAGYSPQGHKESDTTEATQHAFILLSTIFFSVISFLKICIYLYGYVGSWMWYTRFFLCPVGSLDVVSGLNCPTACGILVPQPGIEPTSPTLQGGFLTTGPPGKFLSQLFSIQL